MVEKSYSTRTFQYLSPWNPQDEKVCLPPVQVVTCFLQKEDKVLVLQRAKKDAQHMLWGIPGGKLDIGEPPLWGLMREIFEELQVLTTPPIFQLLGTALSNKTSDGQYGLYVYHAKFPIDCSIQINTKEHYAFRWVTLDEFQALNLLTAQREAFWVVEEALINLLAGEQINQRKGLQ